MVVPNDTPMPFTFAMSKVNATQTAGGSYKIVDTRTFPVSTTVCSAEVTVEVGGMRFVILVLARPRANYLFLENFT
jgi:oxalate decarboxylase/phosphoglucose isomerase-like protein (cupin superfamily)